MNEAGSWLPVASVRTPSTSWWLVEDCNLIPVRASERGWCTGCSLVLTEAECASSYSTTSASDVLLIARCGCRMMLSPEELAALLGILHAEDATFGQVVSRFRQRVPRSEQFRHICGLVLMMQSDVIAPSQQLLALWLIAFGARSDTPSGNPFLPYLVSRFESHSSDNSVERILLAAYLCGSHTKQINEAKPHTCSELLRSIASNLRPDVPSLLLLYNESLSAVSDMFSELRITPPFALDFPVPSTSAPYPQADELVASSSSLRIAPVAPLHVRPPPPLLAPSPFELKWICPERPQVLLWNDCPGGEAAVAKPIVTKLLKEACSSVMTEESSSNLLALIRCNPALIQQCGLVPSRLPDIVEHNPTVAAEVLLLLMSSSEIAKYLQVFVNMPMSLHSMEVVNRLTTSVELPPEFVQHYISNCITTCSHSLIRNNTIDVNDLIGEVQSFCVEFSKIREAAGLFRMLKTMETKQHHGENKR